MSMEEVSMEFDRRVKLEKIIKRAQDYLRFEPLDLKKRGEIQRELLSILGEVDDG